MDRRNRVTASTMNFDNEGYSSERNMNFCRQETASVSRLWNESRVPPFICDEGSLETVGLSDADAKRLFFQGIQQMAKEQSALERARSEYSKPKTSNHLRVFLIVMNVTFVLATTAISTYVFLEHKQLSSVECANHPVGPSITPSKQDKEKHDKIEKLISDIKKLHKKYQNLQMDFKKSQKKSSQRSSTRNHRKTRQNHTTDEDQHTSVDSTLQMQFMSKVKLYNESCMSKIAELKSKIKASNKKFSENPNVGKCKFLMKNTTEVVYHVKKTIKVEIVDDKNTADQLVGVTCSCSKRRTTTTAPPKNAILKVRETPNNITYTCYCAFGQPCDICYWQCGVI